MRVSSFAVARPAYYDRNATSSFVSYDGVVAPHTDTLRATFTTAAGKKAYIETGAIYMRQETGATAVGRSFSVLRITSGSSLNDVARIDSNSSVTANTYRVDKMNGTPTIYAGESLTIRTFDFSTGGSIDYLIGAKITTFDA